MNFAQIKIQNMRPGLQVSLGLISLILAASFLSWKIFFSILAALISIYGFRIYNDMGENPFSKDCKRPRQEYIFDQKKRDAILKQTFHPSKVPNDIDAIVIGSGIGGLTTSVLLAKTGKKVLVLEQHDQAGGCCHTFIDKGYEFDVGIHYIGEISSHELNRTFVDQITEGQVEWVPLDPIYDEVSIGYGKDKRVYQIHSGEGVQKKYLLETFPGEREAIEKYFDMVEETKKFEDLNGLLKILPLWLSWLIAKSGILTILFNFWSGLFSKSMFEIAQTLTKNQDLQTIFTYCWGDFGSPPRQSHFIMQGLLVNHFMNSGGYYPKGGASEIALSMIPIVERSGGKVLVKANVTEIICNNEGQACGVKVKKGSEEFVIKSKIIVSNAGVYNTFQRLLPKEIAQKSFFHDVIDEMRPGLAAFSIFVGLNASNEDLKLKPQNTWAFTSSQSMLDFEVYHESGPEKARDEKVPLVFISFPSAKDPNWSIHPGRKYKSTCAIVTIANYDWFKQWENEPLKRRGDDYESLKKTIADQMIEQAAILFPQIRDHIDYVEIGTPITNRHYLAQPHGEIYGLDHGLARFDPWTIARLRSKTDIPGLYMTGQDALLCGFTGALFGGLLCAGAILGRLLITDLENFHAAKSKKK